MILYRLYEVSSKYEHIDTKLDEGKIIDRIVKEINKNPKARFIVVKNADGSDVDFKYIDNTKAIDSYIANYELKQKTCTELKKDITKDVKIKRLTK